MKHLAIETSWLKGSVAVLDGTEVIRRRDISRENAHGSRLAPAVLKVLKRASLTVQDLDLITVDHGPGSYTGLRVGVSFVKTLAYPDRIPITAVPATDAIAADAPEKGERLFVIIDAEWEEVYEARYRMTSDEWVREGEIRTADPEKVADEADDRTLVLGNGLERYESCFDRQNVMIGDRDDWFPRAETVGRLGLKAYHEEETVEPVSLQPLYLRPTQADV